MTELSLRREAIIEASPEPITIDTARTAVIVVDMQNDFGSKGGMFDRAGVDIVPIQNVVDPISRVLELARRAGMKIIYLKMGFRPDLSDAGPADSPNRLKPSRLQYGDPMRAPDGTESRILIRDTWNTEIVDGLKPQPGDIILYKTRFSGFYQTGLDNILKTLNAAISWSPDALPACAWNLPSGTRCSEIIPACSSKTAWPSRSGISVIVPREAIMRRRSL